MKSGTHVFGRRTPAPRHLEKIHLVLGTSNDTLEIGGIKQDAQFQRHHAISWVKWMVSDAVKVVGSGKSLPRSPMKFAGGCLMAIH